MFDENQNEDSHNWMVNLTLTESEPTVTFETPRYGGKGTYYPNHKCTFKISTNVTNAVIEVNFDSALDIMNGTDTVTIEDKTEGGDKVEYSKFTINAEKFTSKGDEVWVVLDANFFGRGGGFCATAKLVIVTP